MGFSPTIPNNGGAAGVILNGAGYRSGTNFRAKRQWYTNFSDQTLDSTMFTLSGFTYGTDPSNSSTDVVLLTSEGTQGTIFTNANDLQNTDIRVKWKLESTGFNLVNVMLNVYGRYKTSNYASYASVNLGVPQVVAQVTTAGGGKNSSAIGIDNSNSTTWRYMRVRVIDNLMYVKHWFVGSSEPDWQIVYMIDNTLWMFPNGQAGLSLQYGGYISEITVTELEKTDNNLLCNSALNLGVIGSGQNAGFPAYWFGTSTADLSVVQNTDQNGNTRNLFSTINSSPTVNGTGNGPLWEYNMYSSSIQGPTANANYPIQYPRVEFPSAVEIRVWSKGENVAFDGTATLGATIVSYFYDANGNPLNGQQFANDYYYTLGPNGGPATSGVSTGTWDWYETVWRMPIDYHERCWNLRFQFGFHDSATTGTLLVADPQIIPIA